MTRPTERTKIERMSEDLKGIIRIKKSFEFDGLEIFVGVSKDGVSMIFDGVELTLYMYFVSDNIPTAIQRFKDNCNNGGFNSEKIRKFAADRKNKSI